MNRQPPAAADVSPLPWMTDTHDGHDHDRLTTIRHAARAADRLAGRQYPVALAESR